MVNRNGRHILTRTPANGHTVAPTSSARRPDPACGIGHQHQYQLNVNLASFSAALDQGNRFYARDHERPVQASTPP